ncbi:uncharacterized protein LOC121758508 [Salvia splendens]|uniref:uncharacterized protein LOC121758508 n=1 Tax=Salvia splendens TaxID=180675 RepID=UPI001C263AE5|nr:uncharacterized protein LOC121758508 [Salvia splendens]
MTVAANKRRRDIHFNIGDMVYLRFCPHRLSTLFTVRNRKLAPRYFGPFRVSARIGGSANRLELPASARIHPVFQVSLLKRAIGEERAEPTLLEGLIEPPILPERAYSVDWATIKDDGVLCFEFSRDSEMIASGSQDGKTKLMVLVSYITACTVKVCNLISHCFLWDCSPSCFMGCQDYRLSAVV